MTVCHYCGGPNSAEREAIGMFHCTRDECVGEWRRRRIEEKGLALVQVPKAGLMWVSKTDVPKNNRK